jgi:crotonobetainyl-CoA:carnitine CoA-transferase CaiB-like acyl-CoA transferase
VIKVEPVGGDSTRELLGSGAGYFPMFNRNKKSICLDLKNPAGRSRVAKRSARADVVIENFRPARWTSSASATRRCRPPTRA